MDILIKEYRERILSGELSFDDEQAHIIAELNKLSNIIQSEDSKSFFTKAIQKIKKQKESKGFYFYGDVGRGKSMLMNLFFNTLPMNKKIRIHFHSFMLSVHDFLHKNLLLNKKNNDYNTDDGLIDFANDLSSKVRIVCFDEFYIKDVVDALILGRLFTALFNRGVIVIITSNIAPEDLYKDGLQYDLFLPFIHLLKDKLNIISFSGDIDYRFDGPRGVNLYFNPHNSSAENKLDNIFKSMSGNAPLDNFKIKIKGREIYIPKSANGVADFNFKDLFGRPTSALDYSELVKLFKVFIIRSVPQLDDTKIDQIRRFITFIDIAYDEHISLIISSNNDPNEIYTGSRNKEEFKRTVSRLIEIQSSSY